LDQLKALDLDKLNLVRLGLVLGSSQFLELPQLPQKMMLTSKVAKRDLKNNLLTLLVYTSVVQPIRHSPHVANGHLNVAYSLSVC